MRKKLLSKSGGALNEPSKFQQILWNIAGVEKNILMACKTDYQKFAAIGATILMTTVIAFFAGGSAAWFFTKTSAEEGGSLFAVFLFGLLWATLIFCIDRSLVITLKKNPTLKRQKFWVPLISRALLAALIAFMVSIPLELIIFKDFIQEREFLFKEDNTKYYVGNTNEQRSISSSQSIIDRNTKERERLDTEKNDLSSSASTKNTKIVKLRNRLNNPTSQKYSSAINRIREANNEIYKQNIALRSASTRSDSTQLMNDRSKWYNQKRECEFIRNNEIAEWNRPIQEEINQLTKDVETLNTNIGLLAQSANDISNKINAENHKIDTLTQKNEAKASQYAKSQEKSNNFILGFRVLEWAVWEKDANENLKNRTELFFLWIIRLLFFLIEILPTIVKLVMPIGSYDWRIYYEEQNLLSHLNSDEYKKSIAELNLKRIHALQEEQDYHQMVEKTLKKEIIDKMKDAQKTVAELYIDEWKSKAISDVSK